MLYRTLLVFGLALVASAHGAGPSNASTDVASAGPDYLVQGEYVGQLHDHAAGVQVIALGEGKFQAVYYPGGLPGAGWLKDEGVKKGDGAREGDMIVFKGGDEGSGTLKDGTLVVNDAQGAKIGELKRTERKSPTLGAMPPQGAVVVFNGTGIDAFEKGAVLTDDRLITPKGNIVTKEAFGSGTWHIEFMTPFMPAARGQGRGNSGVYLQNRYECQVLDSFGLKGEDNECGGFYKVKRPDVNMCLPPLTWQTYDIDFTAPKFDDAGKKTASARVTVRHNGVVIHNDLELGDATAGGQKPEVARGPLQLQDHGNPVRFRNIWFAPKS